jgi:hypothetical protein
MFRLFRANFRLNLGGCIYVYIYVCVCVYIYIYCNAVKDRLLQYRSIHTFLYVQPEYGPKMPKHVAGSCKFVKYLI